MSREKNIALLKKYHKWPSLVIVVFILLFALSGIVMNHRLTFSSFDVGRQYLGNEYQYKNWNKAAVKSAIQLDDNTALLYGNIGVWKTNDNYQTFQKFNSGFKKGADNHKVEKIIQLQSGDVYCATLFGLFQLNLSTEKWEVVSLPVKEKRIVDLVEIENELFVLTRSNIVKKTEAGFKKIKLEAAKGYDNKTSVFKTLWEFHSGEAFGIAGKLFIDVLGLAFIFLSISGLIYFIYPRWIKRLKKKKRDVKNKIKTLKINLKWHNFMGSWLIVFLILLTLTGMFLRPPLLIAIANNRVVKIPFTHLSNPNPWNDQLRRILYDEKLGRILLATGEGIYYSDDQFSSAPIPFGSQPPISVMGVTVFEILNAGNYLIGSFSGIFYWNPERNLVFDYLTKQPLTPVKTIGPPVSVHPISGYIKNVNSCEIVFDYNLGAGNLTNNKRFTSMPEEIRKTPMSLWNLSLEIHTGRIYRYIFGQFYILFIPVAGILILWILLVGYLLYRKQKGKRLN